MTTFSRAVAAVPSLGGAYQRGLGAIKGIDRQRMDATEVTLSGSIDLDGALQAAQPTSHRWDYGIGIEVKKNHDHQVVWVEVHPCKDGEIPVMLAKLMWLRQWLASDATLLGGLPRKFIWLSSNDSTINKASPAGKRMAQAGLISVGRHFKLKNG